MKRTPEQTALMHQLLRELPLMENLAMRAVPRYERIKPALGVIPSAEAQELAALRDVADAVCKQFGAAGIAARIGSPNPAEDLHARAILALGGQVEREHIESTACWCDPTVEHEDEDVRVIVHRRTQ